MELPPIVSADWAVAHGDQVVLADVRWYLDGRPGRDAFVAGHIPGAVFVDLDTDLTGAGAATDGRHPLPSPEAFAASLGRLGIAADSPVIAYDDSGGMSAGRLVWMLRVLGRPAALLDGGLRAWPEPLETGEGAGRDAVEVAAQPWPRERFTDHQEVAAAAAGGPGVVVLDARSLPRYAGEDATVDARPGHIPGARNAPWAANLDEAGRFRSTEELAARYGALGIGAQTEVVCYCGSGVSACADLLALERIGIERTRLYVPSWSGWSADPDRPADTGRQ